MINIFACIGLGIKLLSKESGLTLLSDAKLLFPYWAPFKAGKLSFLNMHKQQKLRPAWKALKRIVDTVDEVLDDPTADQDIMNVLESIPDV